VWIRRCIVLRTKVLNQNVSCNAWQYVAEIFDLPNDVKEMRKYYINTVADKVLDFQEYIMRKGGV